MDRSIRARLICLKGALGNRIDHRGMKRRLSCVIGSLLAALVAPVSAQTVGDAGPGLSLARQVCSECHDVLVPKSRSPNPKAPAFVDLATMPGMTATALTIALTTPHAGMPMFRLSETQRADLIGYILGLKASTPGR